MIKGVMQRKLGGRKELKIQSKGGNKMKVRGSVLKLGLVLILTAGFLSMGGVAFSADPVKLTFWHHEAPSHRVMAFQKAIDLFEKEHPNIKVKQEVVAWGDAWPKTTSAIRAGTTPDFEFDIPELNLTAYMAGGIVPVDDIVKEIDEKHGYYKSNLGMYLHDDHYWSVPIWTMVFTWLYKPNYLKEYVGTTDPPKTWDQVAEYAKKLTVDKDGDGEIDVYGIGLTGSKSLCTQEFVWAVMTTYGVRIYDKNGKVAFNTPETVKALETYKKLWQYAPPAATGWIWGEIEMNFASGKIAMMPYFPALQKRLFDAGDMDLDGASLPMPPDGQRSTIIYPNGIMIFKSAEKRGVVDEVKEFIRFIMKPEINAILTAEQEPGAFLPVTETAAASDAYWKDKYIAAYPNLNKVAVEEVQHGTLYGFTHGKVVNKGIGDVSGANILAEVAEKVIIQGESAESAAAWGHKKIEELSE
jgi:multiple sugar transport system substrate-binding protein